jgi:hypothetical protein
MSSQLPGTLKEGAFKSGELLKPRTKKVIELLEVISKLLQSADDTSNGSILAHCSSVRNFGVGVIELPPIAYYAKTPKMSDIFQ